MNKQQRQDFLEINYDKLVAMDACNDGLEWFVDRFGLEQTVPLSEVLDKINPFEYEERQYLYWYFDEGIPSESIYWEKYHEWTQDFGEYFKVCCTAAYWYDYFKTLDFVYGMECSL